MLHELLLEKDFKNVKFDFTGLPTVNDREFWNQFEKKSLRIIEECEKYIGYRWPSILFTDFWAFERNGSRTAFENPYFKRRDTMRKLVIAECIENKGRFLDDIINLIVLTCEETFWGLSAHRHIINTGIPSTEDPYIDIYAPDTAELLLITDYLFGDKIEHSIRERIQLEVKKRIVDPFLKHDDFWWEAFPTKKEKKPFVNNWNPWICNNLILVWMLTRMDKQSFLDGIYKIAVVLDHYIDYLPEDGGCDEGASYWTEAAGNCLECLEQYKMYSGGTIDCLGEPLIRKMGHYFAIAFVSPQFVINFADCSARYFSDGYYQYLFGKLTGDEDMLEVAKLQKDYEDRTLGPGNISFPNRRLRPAIRSLMFSDNIRSFKATARLKSVEYLPATQVLKIRKDDNTGLLLSAKGGHNDESHNHNDVGSFIIFADGFPALIDPGVLVYESGTFDPVKRYTYWPMQSSWHNLPEINDVMQSAGRNFAAKNTVFDEKSMSFSLDIAPAYSEDSGLLSLRRCICFNRDENKILLEDSFEFKADNNTVTENFIMISKPSLKGNSLIFSADNGSEVSICFDFSGEISISVEEKQITDKKMFGSWQHNIFRVRVTFGCNKSDTFRCEITGIKRGN